MHFSFLCQQKSVLRWSEIGTKRENEKKEKERLVGEKQKEQDKLEEKKTKSINSAKKKAEHKKWHHTHL